MSRLIGGGLLEQAGEGHDGGCWIWEVGVGRQGRAVEETARRWWTAGSRPWWRRRRGNGGRRTTLVVRSEKKSSEGEGRREWRVSGEGARSAKR
ncbi:unnamed protein product [Linum trigynum]|uniref:Uncharacterized protein n=1 Tax=Linum trigynum TaxID=586398 RepID=A0AAV2DSJ9_9ROSI